MKECMTTITIPRYFSDEEIDRLNTFLEHEYYIDKDDVKVLQISNDIKLDRDYIEIVNKKKSFVYEEKYEFIIHFIYWSTIGILIYTDQYALMIFGFIFYGIWLFGFALENSDNT